MILFIDSELDRLKNEVLDMWTLVYSQLDQAGQAVMTLDKKLANEVIEKENEVNKFELRIDSDIEDIISLYNPVSVHLRFTLAALKINTSLERIGDFAKSMARYVKNHKSSAFDADLIKSLALDEMMDSVKMMLSILKEAFAEESSEKANSVLSMDDLVDRINKNATKVIAKFILNNKEMEVIDSLNLLRIFRKLERVGDHCTNISEELVFYLDAKILKHSK